MIPSVVNMVPRLPKICYWEITDACNLRCNHCELSAGTRLPGELSTDEALGLIDDLAEARCEKVVLTGGEPLLRKDWPLLARRIRDVGMDAKVISNGLLIDEPMIEKMENSNITTVGVSLDGNREVHNGVRPAPGQRVIDVYSHAVRAIALVSASPLEVSVTTQVNRENVGQLVALHDWLVANGVDTWQLQLCMPAGRMLEYDRDYLLAPSELPELIELIAELIKVDKMRIAVADNIGYYHRLEPVIRGSLQKRSSFWTGCKAGCRSVAVCSDGAVKGCPSYAHEFAVGNIRDRRFSDIWNDPAMYKYNTDWDNSKLLGGCADCEFGQLCRAGCTSMAYGATGTIYDNPFCAQRIGRTAAAQ